VYWYEAIYFRLLDTGYPPPILLLGFLWVTWLPMVILLTIAHRWNLLTPFLIQNKSVPDSEYWRATKYALFNFFCMMSPSILFFPMDMVPDVRSPVPSLPRTILTIIGFIVVSDFISYWTHRWSHYFTRFYQIVHKTHHSFYTPFAMTVLAMHPIEYWLGSIFEGISVFLFKPHFFIILVYTVYRSCEGIYAHGGFDLPHLGYIIPVFGGSKFHDLHHSCNTGNYGEILTCWDTWFGTRVYPKMNKEKSN